MSKTPEQIVKKLVADFRVRKGVFQNRINVEDWVPAAKKQIFPGSNLTGHFGFGECITKRV